MGRTSIPEFQVANPVYTGATVTPYTIDGTGAKTAVLATLYANPTGTTTLSNPQTLDSEGKFQQPVYIEDPVIITISGLTIADHDTGIISSVGAFQGDWVTATVYNAGDMIRDAANGDDTKDVYQVVSTHTSGTWATDKADATKLVLVFDVSVIAALMTSSIDPGDFSALAMLRANAGQTAFEGRTAAQVREDISPLTTRGDVIVAGVSGVQQRIAPGAADQAPVYDGTDTGFAGIVKQGSHTAFIPAAAMRPTASNGCDALATVETTAGRPDLHVLDFDDAADEHAQFEIAFPKSWNEGTITFRAFWTSTATDTDGVTWGLQGVAVSDGDTIDVAYGTAVTVDDLNQSTAEDLYVSDISGAVTIAGTPAVGDMCFLRVFRDVSDANDTATEDARLIGVQILYGVNSGDDA